MHRALQCLCIVSVGLLASCSGSPASMPEGTFKYTLSDQHNAIADPTVEASSIKASPSASIEIDAKDYSFNVPETMGVTGPNAIHLYQSNSDNKYRCPWNDGQPIILNGETLEPFDGKASFQGFQEGQSFILAIGHDNIAEAEGQKLVFKPLWVATLDVARP